MITMTAIPEWLPAIYRDGRLSSHHRYGLRLPRWSGEADPPARGETVTVSINAIGKARVVGYFIEHGYLGVEVKPLDPPDWYVRQNGRHATCHVFGAELDEVQS